MRLSAATRLLAGLAAILTLVAVNGLFAYHNVTALMQDQRWIVKTLQLRAAVEEVMVQVVSAEAAQRGYVLTGSDLFRSQFDTAALRLPLLVDSVRNQARQITDNHTLVEALETAVEAKLAFMRDVVTTRAAGGSATALEMVSFGHGVLLMDDVRLAQERLLAEEDRQLQARNEAARTSLHATMETLAAFAFGSLLLSVLIFLSVRSAMRERAEAERRLHDANQMLQSVLDNIPQRIFWQDRELRYLGANKTFLADAGLESPDELRRTNDQALHWPEAATAFAGIGRRVLDGGIAVSDHEIPLAQRDGSQMLVRAAVVPLRDMDSKVVGVLGTYEDVTERTRQLELLHYQANFDGLTGLANRHQLEERLTEAMIQANRDRYTLAVVLLDIDNFKLLNDGIDHAFGDALLMTVAQRLSGLAHEGDTVARYGADEFALVLTEKDGARTSSIVREIQELIGRPIALQGHEVRLTCCIGISVYPLDGAEGEVLLRHADIALHRAKESGKDVFQFFNAQMTRRAHERVALENALRAAVEREELSLQYQPQVDLKSERIIGVEALVRWKHPELGAISPARFIPVAEDSGLVVPIGTWVLRTACAQLKQWQQDGVALDVMSVNISVRQFREPHFVAQVERILEETGLPPSCLELELTESILMADVDESLAVLAALSKIGVRLAVDDFGTGYSSLSYLTRLPVHKLKIDQSFVRGIPGDADSMMIVRTIHALARGLDLAVIAEGVETAAQRDFLASIGCDEIQGYFYSRPLDRESVAQAVLQQHAEAPVTG